MEPEPVLRGMWSQALGTAVYNLDRHLPSILQHEAALVFHPVPVLYIDFSSSPAFSELGILG